MFKELRTSSVKYLVKLAPSLLAIALVGSLITSKGCSCSPAEPDKLVQTCFTPHEACSQFVEAAIARAEHTIYVQAYFFTSPTIAQALIMAHQRGVSVKILVDRSQLIAKGSQVKLVLQKGIPVWVDQVPGIAHNKVMILDEDYVLTGSFNWTDAAQKRNAENLVLIRDRYTNQTYRDNWDQRIAQAQPITLQDVEDAKKQDNTKSRRGEEEAE